ncbi:MAG: proton-conducting transporter membrane subunit, partial [Candidatus Staskawiczbacteria bacterium]|nr:proton-conducting transporter membrane subunit [Candidatus Staskawiczbacteria bacterium]
MLEIITSQLSFCVSLLLFAMGAVGSLIFRKNNTVANWLGSFFAIIGASWGLIFSTSMIIAGKGMVFNFGLLNLPLLEFSFHIDMLSAFFIFIICLIALFCSIYGIGYIKHFYTKYSIGALGFFYNLFIIGMLLVVTANNGIFFLIAWELMSVASYFLVIYDRNDQVNVKAGFLYLVMTHVGTAFIISSFILLYRFTGSFDFEAI